MSCGYSEALIEFLLLSAQRALTDSEIDEQVYKIYGLTEDEKAIVESSLK